MEIYHCMLTDWLSRLFRCIMKTNEKDTDINISEQGMTNVSDSEKTLREATESEYKYGFTSDIDTEIVPPGLNEDVIRFISKVKGEPEWLLDFRLKAFRYWLTLPVPEWAHLKIPEIDFQAISYYAAPKK